jgi:hypothetical protein
MIRDAVLHFGNEQPLLVDLFERPAASDVVLVCTNVRTLSGAKPIWIDHSASVFFFPFAVVRFVEVHAGAEEALGLLVGDAAGVTSSPGRPSAEPEPEAELEIDEDFLRRVRDV